jgi:hypothetical protein
MLAMASRYDPPEWRLSAVIMVAKPFHDRAAAAPEAKTTNERHGNHDELVGDLTFPITA